MSKKTKHSTKSPSKKFTGKLTSGFISRSRFILAALTIIVIVGGLIAVTLSIFQANTVTLSDIPSVQTSDTDKLSGTTTTPNTADTPAVIPNSTVTPGSSSEVPTLKPTNNSNSTASYQSTNWAGYVSTGGNFTTISGTWIASTPTPTSTTVESADGTWIGIGGITTSDLIQIGTQNTISPSGVITTSAFYELLPAHAIGIPSVAVRPGDTISASIAQTSTNEWTLSLSNVSTGRSFSTSLSYVSSLSSAEWIQENPSYAGGGLVLLDNFGTVVFSNATTTVNGTTMSAAASNASPITLIGQGGAAGHTGVPSAINGSSFTVQYR